MSRIIYAVMILISLLVLLSFLFGKEKKWLRAANELISLLPLLGILGTVGGLVFSGDLRDVDLLISGLSTAMYTTFWGLIAAIILKGIWIFVSAAKNRE